MGAVIGDLLPLAVGVAISPIPVIALILMLLATKAGPASTGFAVGWIAGIVVATTVFLLISGVADLSSEGEPSAAASWTKLVIGVLLLALGVMQWRKRPKPGAVGVLPKWMSTLQDFTAVKALGLGFLLAALNPKNLLLCASAGVAVGTADLSGSQDVVAIAVYTVIAGASVLIPVIGYAVAKTKVTPWLDELKLWLQANNNTVMSVLFLLLGAVQVGKALGGIF